MIDIQGLEHNICALLAECLQDSTVPVSFFLHTNLIDAPSTQLRRLSLPDPTFEAFNLRNVHRQSPNMSSVLALRV